MFDDNIFSSDNLVIKIKFFMKTKSLTTVGVAEYVMQYRDEIITKSGIHPYLNGVNLGNVCKVFANYLAMSQAFPYLQSGSQRALVLNQIDNNLDLTEKVQTTTVVGDFLSWDETGGNYVIKSMGNDGLLEMLNTKTYFHSEMFRVDAANLLGVSVESVKPDFSTVTTMYLKHLLSGLESIDDVRRCACMVAFESHANLMIDSLWGAVSVLFNVDKNRLPYFYVHVGGDDPAEAYHVAMVCAMIEKIVDSDKIDHFKNCFSEYWQSNIKWCSDVCKL